MQPVALTGGGMWAEGPCMHLTRLYCPHDDSSREKRSRAAIHGCMSVDNLHPNIILSTRDTAATKTLCQACFGWGGNEDSWKAFLLSVNKRDIQCAARVRLADKLTEGIPPTPRATARLSDSIESDRGRDQRTRFPNHRPLPDAAPLSLAVPRHSWAVPICTYKNRNPLFGWKIPQRWRDGGPLTAGRQWQPNPPMLCSQRLSSWLNAVFTT